MSLSIVMPHKVEIKEQTHVTLYNVMVVGFRP